MIPAAFDYVRASSLDDALSRLADRDGTKVIAGGQSLIPLLRFRLARPPTVLDIGGLEELQGLAFDGDAVRIGALTTLREVEEDAGLAARIPLLGRVIRKIADLQVRNVATLAGGLAHADPASDLPPSLLVLGARLEVASTAGRRVIPIADYFLGPFQTALAEDELITAVDIPLPAGDVGFAYESVEQSASGYPVAGAAARLRVHDGSLREAALAFTGLADTPFLASHVADLAGEAPDLERLVRAADAAIAARRPLEDLAAPGPYRAHVAGIVARRALARALGDAQGAG